MDVTELNGLLWVHFLQVVLVAGLVWLLSCWLPRGKAGRGKAGRSHLNHTLWALVLLKCMTPPVIPSSFGVFSWAGKSAYGLSEDVGGSALGNRKVTISEGSLNPIPGFPADQMSSQPVKRPTESQIIASNSREARSDFLIRRAQRVPWILIWFVGFIAVLGSFLVRLAFFWQWGVRKATTSGECGTADEVQQLAQQVAVDLGIRARPQVLVVDSLVGPAVFGLFRPTVILPKSIIVSLPIPELRALLAHELIHFRRGDLYWSLVQVAALSVSWFNPVAWFASKRFGIATELCCDEETLSSIGIKPKDYALCLISVLEQKQILRAAPLLPGIRPVEVTAKRLEKIMHFGHGSRRSPRWALGILCVGALLVLPGVPTSVAEETETEPVQGEQTVKGIAYEVQILEVPFEKLQGLTEGWTTMSETYRQSGSAMAALEMNAGEVIPAGYVAKSSHAIHLSPGLKEAEIKSLIEAGKMLASPTLLAMQGTASDIRIGNEVPFIASYQPVLTEEGKPSGTMQPIVKVLLEGLEFEVEGQLAKQESEVACKIRYRHSEVAKVSEFRMESDQGELVVQQPEVNEHEIQTSVRIPIGQTVALSAGSYHRIKSVEERKVPILGSIPYVGKLFKNSAAIGEDYSELILIRCKTVDLPTAMEADDSSPKYQKARATKGEVFPHPVIGLSNPKALEQLDNRALVEPGMLLPAYRGKLLGPEATTQR
ncbi:MAG: M56 family metallopeptidase [Aureliella sp.]